MKWDLKQARFDQNIEPLGEKIRGVVECFWYDLATFWALESNRELFGLHVWNEAPQSQSKGAQNGGSEGQKALEMDALSPCWDDFAPSGAHLGALWVSLEPFGGHFGQLFSKMMDLMKCMQNIKKINGFERSEEQKWSHWGVRATKVQLDGACWEVIGSKSDPAGGVCLSTLWKSLGIVRESCANRIRADAKTM